MGQANSPLQNGFCCLGQIEVELPLGGILCCHWKEVITGGSGGFLWSRHVGSNCSLWSFKLFHVFHTACGNYAKSYLFYLGVQLEQRPRPGCCQSKIIFHMWKLEPLQSLHSWPALISSVCWTLTADINTSDVENEVCCSLWFRSAGDSVFYLLFLSPVMVYALV